MFKVFKIIVFTYFIQVSFCGLKREISKKLKEEGIIWNEACTLITGANNDMIEEVIQGKFNETNIFIKRYTLCLWRFCGVMDKEGFLDIRLIDDYNPDTPRSEIDVYAHCNIKALKAEPNDTLKSTWKMQQCLYTTLKDRFIFM